MMALSASREALNVRGVERRLSTVDNRNVECWIARSPAGRAAGPKALVLLLVGKGDRAERWVGAVAAAWEPRPVEVWGMNYPGSGGSEGAADLRLVPPDVLGVFDALETAAAHRPVFIHAGSVATAPPISRAAP